MDEPIWHNGKVVPSAEATVRVTAETALRGINAFEGIRAYWRSDQRCWAVVSLGEHLARLDASLRLLALPAHPMVAPFAEAIVEFVKDHAQRRDLYLRPTIYLDQGSYTSDPERCAFGSFVSMREAPSDTGPVSACVVSFPRVSSAAFPARAKSGAAYSMFRLARLEASAAGYDEAILLDGAGNVTETGGASVFAVSAGHVSTPSLAGDILDSITRGHALEILRSRLGIAVTEREISAGELLAADEVFLTGTLDEVRTVSRLRDSRRTLAASVCSAVRDTYLAMCRGQAEPLSQSMFTIITP